MIKERSAVGILKERERNFRTVFYTVNFSKLESDLSAIKFHLNLALLCYSFFSLFSNYSSKVNLKVNSHQILNLLKSLETYLKLFQSTKRIFNFNLYQETINQKKTSQIIPFSSYPIDNEESVPRRYILHGSDPVHRIPLSTPASIPYATRILLASGSLI